MCGCNKGQQFLPSCYENFFSGICWRCHGTWMTRRDRKKKSYERRRGDSAIIGWRQLPWNPPRISFGSARIFLSPKKSLFPQMVAQKENFCVKKHRRLIVVIIGKNKDDGKKSHNIEGRKTLCGFFILCVSWAQILANNSIFLSAKSWDLKKSKLLYNSTFWERE